MHCDIRQDVFIYFYIHFELLCPKHAIDRNNTNVLRRANDHLSQVWSNSAASLCSF